MPNPRRRHRLIWLFSTLGLFAFGILIGLILQNVWLGLLLATIVSLVWLIAVESRKGGNAGVNDESHGIEV